MIRIDEIESAYSLILGEYQKFSARHRMSMNSEAVDSQLAILSALTTLARAVVEIRKAQEGSSL